MQAWKFLAVAALATTLTATTPESLRDSDAGLLAGAVAPDFKLADQTGREQTLASVMGKNGVVLLFFRSADW